MDDRVLGDVILNASCATGKSDTRRARTVHTATLRHSHVYVRRPSQPDLAVSLGTERHSRLMAFKTCEYWRKAANTPLVSVMWRDGVLYFLAVFSMHLSNFWIFLIAPKRLRDVNLMYVIETYNRVVIFTNVFSIQARLSSSPSSSPAGWSSTSGTSTPKRVLSGLSPIRDQMSESSMPGSR